MPAGNPGAFDMHRQISSLSVLPEGFQVHPKQGRERRQREG